MYRVLMWIDERSTHVRDRDREREKEKNERSKKCTKKINLFICGRFAEILSDQCAIAWESMELVKLFMPTGAHRHLTWLQRLESRFWQLANRAPANRIYFTWRSIELQTNFKVCIEWCRQWMRLDAIVKCRLPCESDSEAIYSILFPNIAISIALSLSPRNHQVPTHFDCNK